MGLDRPERASGAFGPFGRVQPRATPGERIDIVQVERRISEGTYHGQTPIMDDPQIGAEVKRDRK